MKQIEITTRVTEDLNTVSKKLSQIGFNKIRTSLIDDIYMCPTIDALTPLNIADFLKKCVLIRYLDTGTIVFKKLTYKNKVFNHGQTVSEEKINVDINDIEKAKSLFLALGFKQLVRVKYECIVYEKDGLELAFQDVDNLGLLLEYENPNDFEGKSLKIIEKTKQEMLNKVKNLGIATTNEIDVKKAYELIKKEM